MYRIFTWTFMSYVPIFATACFHNVKPQIQKLFCSNWFRFHVGKSVSQLDTKRQAVHVEPITGVQHSALASICLRLFMFMFLNPSPFTTKLSSQFVVFLSKVADPLLELRGHLPAQRQLDLINLMPFFLPFSFEENIL